MKLPFPKDDDGKRMMMSGTSTGRNELIYEPRRNERIYELRETSLIGGNAVHKRDMVDKAVQFEENMDLSGESSDYFINIESTQDAFGDHLRLNSFVSQPLESSVTTESSQVVVGRSAEPGQDITKSGSGWADTLDNRDEDKSDVDDLFKGKSKNSTLAVVEDRQPTFKGNESNPTVPSPTEPSKTSTLRLTERTRSESEDDIEKMEEPEQDGAIIGHRTLYKTTVASAENSTNSQKMDKNGNRSEGLQNEADNDCIVQCLYYTIQCCECIIL